MEQLTQVSFELESMQTDDDQHLDAESEHREEVRSDRLNSDLVYWHLREGRGRSEECPSQTDSGKPPSADTKVTPAGAINSVGNILGEASPRDEVSAERK